MNEHEARDEKSNFFVFGVFNLVTIRKRICSRAKGAELIVRKKDGAPVRGEIIAVKQDSFLLLKRESGVDVTVKVGDISVIIIVRKSQVLEGAGFGALIGILIGGGIGGAMESETGGGGGWGPSASMVGIFIGGLAGIFIGVLGSMVLSKDKTVQFEGKSDTEIQKILESLRKRARVKNAN